MAEFTAIPIKPDGKTIRIGHTGENDARQVVFFKVDNAACSLPSVGVAMGGVLNTAR